jgi:hypothetical protein
MRALARANAGRPVRASSPVCCGAPCGQPSASEQSMPVTSRARCEEADALRKASEDGESEIASKISRKQLEEHTGTENKGGNFERNHFRNLPSSNGERLWPAGEGKLGLRKNYAVGLEIRCRGGAYYWAPEIPSEVGLAGAIPSVCERDHNRAHSFQNSAGLRSRAHPAGADLTPAAVTRRVFLLALAGAESCCCC